MPSSLRLACVALSLCGSIAVAQTLAHPGWRDNGIASEAWWKRTAFVRFGADTTFAHASESLDAMSQAGADSLILPDLLPTGSAHPDAEGVTHPFATKFGTEDDLDHLLLEASARHMHVLLHASLLHLAGAPGELRFWMSRGIAGFDVGVVTPAEMDTLQLLRGAMDRYPGRRILLAHTPAIAGAALRNRDAVTLHFSSAENFSARNGAVQEAVEIHAADALKAPLAPNATVVVDAEVLASEAGRDDLRHLLARQGGQVRTHSARRTARRRSR